MNEHLVDTRWAREKLARARALLVELERAAEGWLDPVAHPLDVVMTDDGLKIEAALQFERPAPLEQWALIVGDCAHNIRTALDVFVWANSTLLPPMERHMAAYPILNLIDEDDEDDEELPHLVENQDSKTRRRVAAKVRGLPEPLRTNVIGNMRWASFRHEGRVIWHQRLPLIREFDDVDKHRLALQLVASQSMATWNVRGLDDAGRQVKAEVSWTPDVLIPTQAGQRTVIAVGTPERKLTRVRGSASIVLGLRVQLFDLFLGVPDILDDFISDVEGLLDVLELTT